MGVKNIIGDLNINGDLNVTGTIMQNGAPIGGGGEPGTFDFSGSDFTDVNMKLFSGNSDFVEEPATIILPSTVTSISVNMFDGASGDFKLFLNSNPSVSASYIPANVDVYFDVSENILTSDAFSASSWSTLTSQMTLFVTGIESGVALQPYTTGSGVPITWYTDETFANTVTVSTGADKKYYGKVLNPSASRVTYCVRVLDLTDASVDIVDSNSGVHYGRFIPVGATVTITPLNTDASKDILVTFNVNGTSYKNAGAATITINADVEIKAVYSDVSYDPILDNNTWEQIRECCESGMAANYWAVGDIKNDEVIRYDNNTSTYKNISCPFRLVDMSGLYGKHAVFETTEVQLQGQWGNNGQQGMSNAWMITTMDTYFSGLINGKTRLGPNSGLMEQITTTNLSQSEYDWSAKLFLASNNELDLSSTVTYNYEYYRGKTFADRKKIWSGSDGTGTSAVEYWLRTCSSSNVYTITEAGANKYTSTSGHSRYFPLYFSF